MPDHKLTIDLMNKIPIIRIYDNETYLKLKHLFKDSPTITFRDGSYLISYSDEAYDDR